MFSVALQRQHLTVAIGPKSLWYIQLACVHYVLSHLTCEVLFMLSSTCLTCTACLTCSHAFVLYVHLFLAQPCALRLSCSLAT